MSGTQCSRSARIAFVTAWTIAIVALATTQGLAASGTKSSAVSVPLQVQPLEPIVAPGRPGDEPNGPADDRPCNEACGERAANALNDCIDAGGDPMRCEERAGRVEERCMHECNEHACRLRCDLRARNVHDACIDAGGSEEECGERVREFLHHCMASCEPLHGRELCYLIARRHVAECASNGLPAEECEAEGQEILYRCLNAPPANCGERCDIRGHEFHDHCVEIANPDVDCEAATHGFVDDCLNGCAPITCDETCGVVYRTALRRCLRRGGEQAACEAVATDAESVCLDECAGGE